MFILGKLAIFTTICYTVFMCFYVQKDKISHQIQFFHNLLFMCFYVQKDKISTKFQNFPPNINISQKGASQFPHFFPTWACNSLFFYIS